MAGTNDRGAGISGFGVAKEEETPLSGTGGAAGPGTRAGEGEPSGEGIDSADGTTTELAKEAAALGNFEEQDKTPALEYGEGDRPRGPTLGEALGSGAGAHVGSGTPAGGSGIGGGKAPHDEGSADSAATRSPGGSH